MGFRGYRLRKTTLFGHELGVSQFKTPKHSQYLSAYSGLEQSIKVERSIPPKLDDLFVRAL